MILLTSAMTHTSRASNATKQKQKVNHEEEFETELLWLWVTRIPCHPTCNCLSKNRVFRVTEYSANLFRHSKLISTSVMQY